MVQEIDQSIKMDSLRSFQKAHSCSGVCAVLMETFTSTNTEASLCSWRAPGSGLPERNGASVSRRDGPGREKITGLENQLRE